MAESILLTTPITQPIITDYRLVDLCLHVEAQVIECVAASNTGTIVSRRVTGPEALTILTALNKADLTVKSLQRRVLEYMNSKGDFTGTITGVPD